MDSPSKKDKPVYYKENFYKKVNSVASYELMNSFVKSLTASYTPVQVRADICMKPIPPELGMLQLILERNKSGFNKFWPKYTLSISNNKLELIHSKKLANSSTAHYKIEISNAEGYKK